MTLAFSKNKVAKFFRRKYWIVNFLLFICLCIVIHLTVSRKAVEMISYNNGSYTIGDFIYHILVIKSFWFGEIPSIYQHKSQLAAMANFFQIQPNAVMPIGVTPTVLVLWFPFAFLARFDLPLAQTLWVSSSLAVLIFALLKTYLFLCAYKRSLLPIYFIVLCIFVSSFTTVAAILLGQTGILASGLLILLVIEINQANNAGRPLRRMLVYAMIFLLPIKIPYLVAGIGLLFIFGFILLALIFCKPIDVSLIF